jgi:hypothetical protein
MKVFTLAAGMAVGYVLGSRAGREKYEQIVAGYQKLSGHPTVVQTQEKAKELLNSGTSTAISKLDPTTPDTEAEPPVTAPQRQRRRKAAAMTPELSTDPTA